jgi:NAD(P)-dependent dehydrogenase (short-subunit alcohol dehydrogenase family)
MYRNLKNKNIIITGGSGFLGSQMIKGFLKNKSKLIILDLNKPKIKNKNLVYFNCDITNEIEVKRVLNKIKKKIKIDVLINNAARDYIPQKKNKKNIFENFELDNWNKDLSVGLGGAFICTKIFGTEMAKNKKGIILNISSDLGIIAPTQDIYKDLNFIKPVTYSVVKHGIIGLTKYTAAYWAKKNVRCNAIAPGGILNNQNKKFLNKIKKVIPLNRLAKKNEYNDLILFLCSDSASYMTGSIVVADGGRTII